MLDSSLAGLWLGWAPASWAAPGRPSSELQAGVPAESEPEPRRRDRRSPAPRGPGRPQPCRQAARAHLLDRRGTSERCGGRGQGPLVKARLPLVRPPEPFHRSPCSALQWPSGRPAVPLRPAQGQRGGLPAAEKDPTPGKLCLHRGRQQDPRGRGRPAGTRCPTPHFPVPRAARPTSCHPHFTDAATEAPRPSDAPGPSLPGGASPTPSSPHPPPWGFRSSHCPRAPGLSVEPTPPPAVGMLRCRQDGAPPLPLMDTGRWARPLLLGRPCPSSLARGPAPGHWSSLPSRQQGT